MCWTLWVFFVQFYNLHTTNTQESNKIPEKVAPTKPGRRTNNDIFHSLLPPADQIFPQSMINFWLTRLQIFDRCWYKCVICVLRLGLQYSIEVKHDMAG